MVMVGRTERGHVAEGVAHYLDRLRRTMPVEEVVLPEAGRGDAGHQTKLAFVRFEPLVQPKRALSGDGTERVDTRVLEVIYALPEGGRTAYVGQQMDVFIEAEPLGIE